MAFLVCVKWISIIIFCTISIQIIRILTFCMLVSFSCFGSREILFSILTSKKSCFCSREIFFSILTFQTILSGTVPNGLDPFCRSQTINVMCKRHKERINDNSSMCNRISCLVGLFCCFTSQVNSYGHCGTVSSPNHTFSWAGLNKRLTSNWCTYFRL